ncbi:hypothetical protein L1987_31112 [Smallanthus sonchifolius]|uniref:Uncharacterized protein n=1 Tax=Smallanthus sonchifolius TaxID=185202 RepID=A0ACB9I4R1_9ASTR|nr:hypothetical protein L1987_31112 [Smallanthus sonchifolius]
MCFFHWCLDELVSILNCHKMSRRYDLQHVQKLLLEDVIKRLGRKKILLVLDDVDALSQLEHLQNKFGDSIGQRHSPWSSHVNVSSV